MQAKRRSVLRRFGPLNNNRSGQIASAIVPLDHARCAIVWTGCRNGVAKLRTVETGLVAPCKKSLAKGIGRWSLLGAVKGQYLKNFGAANRIKSSCVQIGYPGQKNGDFDGIFSQGIQNFSDVFTAIGDDQKIGLKSLNSVYDIAEMLPTVTKG